MIARYTRPEMAELWSLESRYRAWLEVELAVCEAWHEQGVISVEDMAAIRDKAAINVDRIEEIEATTRHDVIAFLTSLEEKIGPAARFIHLGCTSSDIVDSAGALLLAQNAFDTDALQTNVVPRLNLALLGLGTVGTYLTGRARKTI